jgi:trk system potassium uptake protein TrkA
MPIDLVDKKTQYAVIGLGLFGMTVANSLVREGAEVIVVDRDKNIIDQIKDKQAYPYILDGTNEDALREAGIDSVDCAVVCIGKDMVASILSTLLMKKFKIPRIIARANNQAHAQILSLMGVSQIIEPEVESAQKLAKQLVGQMGFLVSYEKIWKDHAIVEVRANNAMVGKSLAELDFRKKFGINVIAIKTPIEKLSDDFSNVMDFDINEVPDPSAPIKDGEILIIIGNIEAIEKLNKHFMREVK